MMKAAQEARKVDLAPAVQGTREVDLAPAVQGRQAEVSASEGEGL